MSLEEQIECPLCMEPLEMDDINFFPCTCGYQICRFCWHRIRTDENGLCPACRKAYPEDPAEFKPLTEDELQRIKKERRQKDLQRKQKAAESRKHLANVRVVQRNLVFVVGLSQRLADPEVLKKHDYFGKFGKIVKVVINQSTSYAGAQVGGPSASAYITYYKSEDALRAIQAVNNIHVDRRTLKASLGTTKYCSHFLRGSQCPKPDCMYLHELGEEAASFTKEEMQQGKHQEYEQRLYEQFMNNQNLANMAVTASQPPPPSVTPPTTSSSSSSSTSSHKHSRSRKKNSSPTNHCPHSPQGSSNDGGEAWPSLGSKTEHLSNGRTADSPVSRPDSASPQSSASSSSSSSAIDYASMNRAPGYHRTDHSKGPAAMPECAAPPAPLLRNTPPGLLLPTHLQHKRSLFDHPADSMSLFSMSGFTGGRPPQAHTEEELIPAAEIPDSIPVSTTTDWQAAFGFTPSMMAAPPLPPPSQHASAIPSTNHFITENHDDDLGFDPWAESSKALADLVEKEGNLQQQQQNNHTLLTQQSKNLPPGFTQNHIGAFHPTPYLPLGCTQQTLAPLNTQHKHDNHSLQDWQDGLRALLPNINISFGQQSSMQAQVQQQPQLAQHQPTQHRQTSWELPYDPAIVTSGNIERDEPHWMASLHSLTEETPSMASSWSAAPPPGFQTNLHPATESKQQLATEGL